MHLNGAILPGAEIGFCRVFHRLERAASLIQPFSLKHNATLIVQYILKYLSNLPVRHSSEQKGCFERSYT